jgi:hypothetical protein
MPDAGGPHDFTYLHTDIPEGMTIREWRAQRAAERGATQAAEREQRRRRRAGTAQRWLAVLPTAALRPRLHNRQAHG